jgi:hypothetical protein
MPAKQGKTLTFRHWLAEEMRRELSEESRRSPCAVREAEGFGFDVVVVKLDCVAIFCDWRS